MTSLKSSYIYQYQHFSGVSELVRGCQDLIGVSELVKGVKTSQECGGLSGESGPGMPGLDRGAGLVRSVKSCRGCHLLSRV